MTDPKLFDPATNVAYYANNNAFRPDPNRLKEHRVQWAAERLNHKLEPDMRVLDLGASDAYFAQLLRPGVEYVGVELNATAIRQAKWPQGLHPNTRIIQGDVMDFSLWPGTWDRVWVGETLEHLVNPLALLKMIRERLHRLGSVATTSAAGQGEAHEPGNDEHLREWTPEEYEKLHRDAGLHILESGVANVYGERYANVVWAHGGP